MSFLWSIMSHKTATGYIESTLWDWHYLPLVVTLSSQEKAKIMLVQNFLEGVVNKVYYGQCESGECAHLRDIPVLPTVS